MKQLAKTTNKRPREIYDQVISHSSQQVGSHIPFLMVSNCLNKIRQSHTPPKPKSLEESIQVLMAYDGLEVESIVYAQERRSCAISSF